MIGDLIQIGSNVGKVCSISAANHQHPDLIVYTLAGKFNENSNIIGLERALPIPLTPEILEKNGFQTKKYYDGIKAIIDNDEWGYWIWIKGIFYNFAREEDDQVMIKCEYVHQLQHFLRIIGIEKKIML